MSDLEKLFEAIKNLTPKKGSATTQQEEIPERAVLIVGLGNPGREYRDTRHNIGFVVADRMASQLGVDFSRSQSKALITDGRYQGTKIILAKPQTYMNKSGHAVRALLKFYKLSHENLVVAYDDVDLPFGTIRLKPAGGSGGHKGMQSIIEQLGTQEFARLRLGVGRPPGYKQAANYVLKPFSKAESEFLDSYLERAVEAVQALISDGIEYAMTKYNRNEQGFADND